VISFHSSTIVVQVELKDGQWKALTWNTLIPFSSAFKLIPCAQTNIQSLQKGELTALTWSDDQTGVSGF